jgi:hypothetical protein
MTYPRKTVAVAATVMCMPGSSRPSSHLAPPASARADRRRATVMH